MKCAKEIYPDENTKIVAVLLKTGNASSIGASAANEEFGFFSRTDLLEALKKHSDTNNAIIDDIFVHRVRIEKLTNRFSKTKVNQWSEQDPKIHGVLQRFGRQNATRRLVERARELGLA